MKRRGGGVEPGRRQTSYLLYLTEDGVFLKELTMRDGGRNPLPPHDPPPATRPPVFKKMFNAAESKTR